MSDHPRRRHRFGRWARRQNVRAPVDCAEVGRVMQSFLDGELDGDLDAIARHLEGCRQCGLEVATYERVCLALAQPSTEPVDPTVLERLREFGAELATEQGP